MTAYHVKTGHSIVPAASQLSAVAVLRPADKERFPNSRDAVLGLDWVGHDPRWWCL